MIGAVTVTGKGVIRVWASKKRNKLLAQINNKKPHTFLINGVLDTDLNTLPYAIEKIVLTPLFKPEKPLLKSDLEKTVRLKFQTVGKVETIAKQHKIYVNWEWIENRRFTPYEIMFILSHELGHRFYKSEHKCDLFALHFCVRNGIDPRFLNFNKLLRDKKRRNFIKNSIRIKKL